MKNLLLIPLLLLAGCQHVPPTVFVREVPVEAASTSYLDVIRFPAAYKSYTVGRRPDPANPGFMHEAHILYVRETPDRWNLQPAPAPAGPPASVPVSNSASQDAAFVPLPLNEQLRQEMQKQQQISQSLADQTQRFQQTADVLVPAARKAMELTTQVQQTQKSIDDRLRKLEETQRPASFTNWPSLSVTNR